MRGLPPLCVVVLGLALGAFLPWGSGEASAQVRPLPKPNAPKPPKDLKPPKPHVNKKVQTNVRPQNGHAKLPEPQKISNEQLVRAIHVLRSVHLTLKAANHDYGGHKGAALRDIDKAEKSLKEALKFVGDKEKIAGGKTPVTGSGTRHPEPQKLSNGELASVIPVLKRTSAIFEKKADHDYGGHLRKANDDLKASVRELEKALKFAK